MSLLKYIEFILENSNSLVIYYSKEFKEILIRIRNSIDHQSPVMKILIALITIEGDYKFKDIYTLIDITDKNDKISLMQSNRIIKKLNIKGDDHLQSDIVYNKNHELWASNSRTEIGIGKWTRRVIRDVYDGPIPTDKALEMFVNLYKSTYDYVNNIDSKFEIVEGDGIAKWYLEDNYDKDKGQLGHSCMRQKSKQSFFEIYVKNPQVCKLLILKNDKGDKILGRALLWQLKNGYKYQDRIYTNHDSDVLLFEKWAKDNDYIYYNESDHETNLEVQLKDIEYTKFPYMDTFCVFNKETKILKADEDLWPNQGYVLLQRTDGKYETDERVWSDYHEEYLDPNSDDVIECKVYGGGTDHLRSDSATYLEYIDEYWVPDENIVYSDYHEGYYLMNDVVYSEILDVYLYVDDDVIVQVIVNSYGDIDYVPKERTDVYMEIKGEYYYKENIIKDPYTGDLLFKDEKTNGKRNDRYILDKLEKEFGDGRKYIDENIERLSKIYKSGDYPDIKGNLKSNKIVENILTFRKIGITIDDIICILFASIGGLHRISNDLQKFDTDVYDKYKSLKDTSEDEWTTRLSKNRVVMLLSELCGSFDYTLLGNDVYKLYLWFNL